MLPTTTVLLLPLGETTYLNGEERGGEKNRLGERLGVLDAEATRVNLRLRLGADVVVIAFGLCSTTTTTTTTTTTCESINHRSK